MTLSLILAVVAIIFSVLALALGLNGLVDAWIPTVVVSTEDPSGFINHSCGCIEQVIRIPEQATPVGRFSVRQCGEHGS